MAISELDLPTGVIAHSSADAQRQAELMADSVAKALRYAVQTHGVASLVVSGGRSPVAFFESLSRRELDWAKIQISRRRALGLANRSGQQRRLAAAPPSAECRECRPVDRALPASRLARAGCGLRQCGARPMHQPIDVLVLGMGDDGTLRCSQAAPTWRMPCGRIVPSAVWLCRHRSPRGPPDDDLSSTGLRQDAVSGHSRQRKLETLRVR